MNLNEIERLVQDQIKFINANREMFVKAWIAETGFLPSESMLIEQRDGNKTTIWIEKKYGDLPKHDYPKMDKMIERLKAADALASLVEEGKIEPVHEESDFNAIWDSIIEANEKYRGLSEND